MPRYAEHNLSVFFALKSPKHHASTGHMTQDQVWVPSTRSQKGLPPLDPKREDRLGARASAEVQKELWEALGDSPIGASWGVAVFLVSPCAPNCNLAHLTRSSSAGPCTSSPTHQDNAVTPRVPTVRCLRSCYALLYVCADYDIDFDPKAAMFSPHHWVDVVLSDIGVVFWLIGLAAATYVYGIRSVFVLYLQPYLWLVSFSPSFSLVFPLSLALPFSSSKIS